MIKKEKEYINIFNFKDHLTIKKFEDEIKDKEFCIDGKWSQIIRDKGLIVDLRKARRVQPSAVGMLILFLEHCAYCGNSIVIKLPYPLPTQSERKYLKKTELNKTESNILKSSAISEYIESRKISLNLLKRFNFIGALKHSHIRKFNGKIRIFHGDDWSIPEENDENKNIKEIEKFDEENKNLKLPWYFEKVFPFEWIGNTFIADERDTMDDFFRNNFIDSLYHKSEWVQLMDIKTIADVFLQELIENTIFHGKREYALIGAWTRPNISYIKEKEVLKHEILYIERTRNTHLIEAFVGDSGKGIISTLKDNFNPNVNECKFPDPIQTWSPDEKVLVWSFDKYSTRKKVEEKRFCRGLYRVQRVAKKYSGYISLRCNKYNIGVNSIIGDDYECFVKSDEELGFIPGTVFNIRIPVIEPRNIPEIQYKNPIKKYNFIVYDDVPEDDYWEKDPEKAVDTLHKKVTNFCQMISNRSSTLLVIDFNYRNIPYKQKVKNGKYRVFDYLLTCLMEIADSYRIVITNIESPSFEYCEQSINSIDEKYIRENGNKYFKMNKILFKHADERWKWIGISETLRNILEFFPSWDIITTEDMMTYISKEYLNQKLNEKILNEKLNEKLNRIIMEIRDNPLLFTYKKNKGLFFHFNFSDIYFALKKNLIKKINIAIYKGNNKTGVYKGKFVTPTLNIIDKFINTDIFFEVNNLLDSVASNLAFGCTPYIEKNNQKLPIEILVDSKVSFKLIDKFRERLNNILGGQKGYKKQDIWIQILGPTDYPAVRGKKSNVIIFSDIISSSNKVIWLSSRAMRVNRVPITIITAMDARLVKSKTLEVLGNKIRLFAIAKIILQTKDKSLPYSSLESINPITLKPEKEKQLENGFKSSISDEIFIKLIKERKAIYPKHIVRLNGRHFTFYLDVLKLLGDKHLSNKIILGSQGIFLINTFINIINEWSKNKNITPDVIFYPYTQDFSVAQIISEQISLKMNNKRSDEPVKLYPVKRIGDVSNSNFIEKINKDILSIDLFNKRRNAIIIDKGAISGTTIRRLIQLVSEVPFKNLLVIILLNQLSFNEEIFLKNLGLIGYKNTKGNYSLSHTNVEIKFITRFPFESYNRFNCPHCRTIKLLDEENKNDMPLVLRNYIEEKVKPEIRAYSLEGILEEVKRDKDYFNSYFKPSLLEKIIDFRNLLKMSALRTTKRIELYRELNSLQKNKNNKITRIALISLLVKEWFWLKEEPLRLIKFKRLISLTMINIIMDDSFVNKDKIKALIILRTSSKYYFVKYFSIIFKKIYKEEDLVYQLLYCAHTYINREYFYFERFRPENLNIFLKEIEKCNDFISKRGSLCNTNNLISIISYLSIRSNFIIEYNAKKENSLGRDWLDLKRKLYDILKHHSNPVIEGIDDLRFGGKEEDLDNRNWHDLFIRYQNDTEKYLLKNIIPRIKKIEKNLLLISKIPGYIFSIEDANKLQSDNVLKNIIDLRTILQLFSKNPEKTRDKEYREKFFSSRDFIWEYLLDPTESTSRSIYEENSNILARILNGCPCKIVETINNFIEEINKEEKYSNFEIYPIEEEEIPSELEVFCHQKVLESCFKEIFNNISKTIEPLKKVLFKIKIENNICIIEVKNNGKKNKNNREGTGISTYNGILNSYDNGSLTFDKINNEEIFKFKTVIELKEV